MHVTVRELMSRKFVTVPPDMPVIAAVELMLSERSSEMYVVDQCSRLLGVVSDYDLLKVCLAQTSTSSQIDVLMTRHMLTLAPDTDLPHVVGLFRDGRYTRVAVVENGFLVGQVSRQSVLRAFTAVEAVKRAMVTISEDGPHTEQRQPRFMKSPQASAMVRDQSPCP